MNHKSYIWCRFMSPITSGGNININVTEKVKAVVKELTCIKEATGWQLSADRRLFSFYRHFFEADVRIANRL